MPALLSVLLVFFLSVTCDAEPRFKVNRIEKGGRTALPVQQTSKWAWSVVEQDARVLGVLVSFESAFFSGFNQVRALSKSTRAILKGNRLLLRLDAMGEKLVLAGGGRRVILEVRSEDAPGVVDENCKGVDLILRPVQGSLPFYVGASCKKVGDSTRLTVTFPREVEIAESTLFESKGKGEPWRYYELGKINLASGQLGKLVVAYQGRTHELVLEAIQVVAQSKQELRTTLFAGGGIALLGISGPDIEAATASPLVNLRIPHYPLAAGFGVALNIDFSVPMGLGPNAIRYTQFEVYGSFEWAATSWLKLRPKAGYVIFSQSNEQTGIALSSNQAGFGAVVAVRFLPSWSLELDGMLCGFGSNVVTSQYSAELGIHRRGSGPVGFGIGARLQNFAAVSALGIARQFSQMSGFAQVSF